MASELELNATVSNRPRGRWWRRGLTVIGVVATSALVAWLTAILIAGHHEPDVVYMYPATAVPVPEPAPPPAPIILQAQPPGAAGELGPCPPAEPPRDPAVGQPWPDVLDGHLVEPLLGATASRSRAGWLAAWTGDTILLSTDDGRSFSAVLPGPGQVRGVAIDCHGRVFALRDDGLLGVRHGDRESWQVIDRFSQATFSENLDRAPHLAADGGVIALAGSIRDDINVGVLLLSTDGGLHWTARDLQVPGSWEGVVDLAIDRQGTVRVLSRWGDCMVEGSRLTTFDARGAAGTVHDLDPHLEAGAASGDGWVHAPCGGQELCAWTASGADRSVTVPPLAVPDPEVVDPEPEIVGGIDFALARFRGQVVRLQRGRARLLGEGAHLDQAFAVDHGGRLLGLKDGRLARWSPRHGLRLLLETPTESCAH